MSGHNAIHISIDPVTLVSQECIKIISEIRKNSRFFQSGVAAILSTSDVINLFSDEFVQSFKPLNFSDGHSSFAVGSLENARSQQIHSSNTASSGAAGTSNGSDPILSSFLQLKSLLSEIDNLTELDTLTILQPYFMLISSPSTSGLITSITLNSLIKLFEYNVLFDQHSHKQLNTVHVNINQLIHSLTHTQFESSDPTLDDSVLLKVLDLILRIIKDDRYNNSITNDIFLQVIQINLSLACNKKRSEVLRRYAEQSLNSITIIIFSKLKYLDSSKLSSNNSQNEFPSVAVDLKFYYQYFLNLISIVSIENQYYHTESTKIFVLGLLSTVIETSGKIIPRFPLLLKLVKNPLFKNLLTIILKNDSLNLLQAALQCFISLNLILGKYLTLQLEFAYENIFKSILPADEFNQLDESIDENTNPKNSEKGQSEPLAPGKLSRQNTGASRTSSRVGTPVQGVMINSRNPLAKELIIESLSLLWTHSSELLTNLFINFDCKFDSKNISLIFIKFLNKLAESSSAAITTNNVPPICLEGLLQLINGLNSRVKALKKKNIEFDLEKFNENKILKIKQRKEEFLRILNILNNEDFKAGLQTLRDKKFLSTSLPQEENDKELGEFFYYKASLLNKKNVGEFITKPKNLPVLIHFLALFNFKGKRVDESLRLLLQRFRVPGESQQIERVVENFADKYVNDQNFEKVVRDYEAAKELFKEGKLSKEPVEPVTPEKDGVFILSYAIIMLNTDLHNPKIKEHMSFEAFKKNLRGVYKEGKDYPEWYLKTIYTSIKNKEIIIPEEHYGTDKWFTGSWDILISSSNNANEKTFVFAFEKNIDDPPHEDEVEFKKLKSGSISVKDVDPIIVSQFDKVLFENSFSMLLKSFIHVFEETGDDSRVAKLMSTIDKCANIASYYKLGNILDNLLIKLAALTTLTGEKKSERITGDDEFIRDHIPTTQLKVLPTKKRQTTAEYSEPSAALSDDGVNNVLSTVTSNDSATVYGNRKNVKTIDINNNEGAAPGFITVSETSTWFGRDFKAQISLVALFNIIRKNQFSNFSRAWHSIMIIILRLYENSIIDGNFFSNFQNQLHLKSLPKVKPQYFIDKTVKKSQEESEVSLFSAFTSYLKINSDEPPEPTSEEIEATYSTNHCIEQSKIESIFKNWKTTNSSNPDIDVREMIISLLNVLPPYKQETRHVYQNSVLFIFESTVAITLYAAKEAKNRSLVLELSEKIIKDIDRLIVVNEKNRRKLLTEEGIVRVISYELVLFNSLHDKLDNSGTILKRGIQLLLTLSKSKVLEVYASALIPQLLSLLKSDDSWKYLTVIDFDDYWKLIRSFASITKHVGAIFDFMKLLVRELSDRIVPNNYMSVLGLFDEVSSIGAIGSAFEQEADLAKKSSKDDNSKKAAPTINPHRALVDISIASINLTCELKSVFARPDFVETEEKTQSSGWYALIQAIGHQTFNPCREVRSHALKVFTNTLLSLDLLAMKFITAKGIFEFDIFPLVTELLKDEVLYCDFYGMKKTKGDVLSNATKIYLQYLNKSLITKEETYTEDSELSYIWLSLLDVFKSLIVDEKRNLQVELKSKKKASNSAVSGGSTTVSSSTAVIKEASKELIKNSLLYMQDCQYLNVGDDKHKYVWDETWKRISEVYPELEEEFLGELKEIQKNNSERINGEKKKDVEKKDANGENAKEEAGTKEQDVSAAASLLNEISEANDTANAEAAEDK